MDVVQQFPFCLYGRTVSGKPEYVEPACKRPETVRELDILITFSVTISVIPFLISPVCLEYAEIDIPERPSEIVGQTLDTDIVNDDLLGYVVPIYRGRKPKLVIFVVKITVDKRILAVSAVFYVRKLPELAHIILRLVQSVGLREPELYIVPVQRVGYRFWRMAFRHVLLVPERVVHYVPYEPVCIIRRGMVRKVHVMVVQLINRGPVASAVLDVYISRARVWNVGQPFKVIR